MPVALLAQAGPKGLAYACKDCASRLVQKQAACKAIVSMGFYVLGAQGPPPYFLHGPAHSIRLLWFPIGFNGPYAMRQFYVAYYLHFKPSGIS